MLKLAIQNLEDGESAFAIEEQTKNIDNILPVFRDAVKVSGTVLKTGNRYIIQGIASSDAVMVCDLSLEEFAETIQASIHVVAVVGDDELSDDSIILLREDDKYINLTEEVQQELAVHLPMKAISPKYRGMSFNELHPELSADGEQSESIKNERWSALKNISFDSQN